MVKILSDTINELISQEDQIIIAIEGGCTSGKTTLASKLSEIYDANVIHMDDFFLPFEMRTEERMKEIGGNIDYDRFNAEVAEKIIKNETFSYSVFDCSSGKINKTVTIEPKRLNIVEGVYSMHPLFDKIYTLKVFLMINKDEQITRLKARNPEKFQRFINEWIPKENEYFSHFRIKEKCDLVLDIIQYKLN